DAVDRVRPRLARHRRRRLLAREPVADSVRGRSAAAHPPGAARAAARGAGADGSKDGPVQRPALLDGADRRAGSRAALRPPGIAFLRAINNPYGHLVGDEVLGGVADVSRDELRDYDAPARFGGEEFAILLPETSYEHALDIAERIRKAVADRVFDFEDAREPVSVTVSMGVASFPEDGRTPNELVHRADLAGYRAKLQGRNRVQGARSEPLLIPADRAPRLVALPPVSAVETPRERRHRNVRVSVERRRTARPDRQGLRRLVQRLMSDRPTLDRTPASQLREAAETIRAQNVLLSEANQLLRQRSTAAMESLSATIDARDAYTAG